VTRVSAPGAIRFASVLIVVAAWACVLRGGEARVGAQREANALTAARLRAAQLLLAQRTILERERARDATASTPPAGTRGLSSFVRDAAASARARRTAITAIASAGRDPRSAVFDLTLEGRFADVLATIGALSDGAVPARVDIAAVAKKNAAARDALVAATVRVTLPSAAGQTDARPGPA
jgi:hypothetical protein